MKTPQSKAETPEAYLGELTADRASALATVRAAVRANLPSGYEESMGSGMIVYGVPTSRFMTPDRKPLWYVALAAQKNFNSLYLMSVYGSEDHARRLRDGFARAGKKLDMGKSCIHFRDAADLALDIIGELIASVPVEKWIAIFEASRRDRASARRSTRAR